MYMQDKKYPKSEVAYLVLASKFAVLLVLTNIIGIKLFQAPAYSVTSSISFYSAGCQRLCPDHRDSHLPAHLSHHRCGL